MEKYIRVVDVEYTDDDDCDCRVYLAVDDDTTEAEVVEHLYFDCGYTGVFVNDFDMIAVDRDFDKFDFVKDC